jgi:hypothetical protein
MSPTRDSRRETSRCEHSNRTFLPKTWEVSQPPPVASQASRTVENRMSMRFLSEADAGTRTPDPLLTIVSKGVSSVREVPSCLGFWRPERPCETGISAYCAPGSPHDGAGLVWSLQVSFYSVRPRNCRQTDGDSGGCRRRTAIVVSMLRATLGELGAAELGLVQSPRNRSQRRDLRTSASTRSARGAPGELA